MYGEIVRLLSKNGEFTYSINTQMISCISLWSAMYENKPPWAVKRKKSANLSVQIASEAARLVTLEFKSEVTGSKAADYLNGIYASDVLPKLRKYTEYGLAKGSLIIKPVADKNGIKTQFIQADRFFPVSFDGSGNLIKCVFADQAIRELLSLSKKLTAVTTAFLGSMRQPKQRYTFRKVCSNMTRITINSSIPEELSGFTVRWNIPQEQMISL